MRRRATVSSSAYLWRCLPLSQAVADLREERDRGVRCRLVFRDAQLGVAALDEVVHRSHHDEIDCGCYQVEVDDRGQQNAELKVISVDGHLRETVKVGGSNQGSDQ